MLALWEFFWPPNWTQNVPLLPIPPQVGPQIRWSRGGFGNFWMP